MKTQTATATKTTASAARTLTASGNTIHVPPSWVEPLPQRPTLLHFRPGLGEQMTDPETGEQVSYPVAYALRAASGATYPVVQRGEDLVLHPERYLDDESLSHVGGQVASTL